MIRAIIYLPLELALDSLLARHCLEHIGRRGYELLTVAREWAIVVQLLHLGRAEVVVFARRGHIDPNWTPRFEIVGDDTRDLCAGRPRKDDRHREGDDRPRLL